jgi:tripartite-type tricarboxylate transporter receptor subunit TctC
VSEGPPRDSRRATAEPDDDLISSSVSAICTPSRHGDCLGSRGTSRAAESGTILESGSHHPQPKWRIMNPVRFALCCLGCLAVFASGASVSAAAQEWPTRAVRVMVPYGPGGVTDIMARVSADRLSRELGQPFVIENRGGAGGVIGTEAALRSPRDGYTIFFGSTTQVASSPLIHKIKYDPRKDLVAVSVVGENIMGFATNPALGLNTVEDLIAYVKARPGAVNYAIAGIGTNSHLSGAAFARRAGLEMIAVPYPAAPQAMTALMAGDVSFYFGNLSDSLPFVSTGKLKVLAVTSEQRKPELPEIPTVSETLPGFTLVSSNGYFGLGGTPQPILKRLETAVIKAMTDPDARRLLLNNGVDPVGSSADYMRLAVDRNIAMAEIAVDAAGLRLKE